MSTVLAVSNPKTTQQSLEIQLLLYCARTNIDDEIKQSIKTLTQLPVNWNTLIRLAESHKVTPLLYQNLNAVCPAAIPSKVLKRFQQFFHANALNNQFLTLELLEVLKLLRMNGIEAIPFKGATLAEAVYGDLALRQFADLDLFIDKAQLQPAIALLLERGYELGLQHDWETHLNHCDRALTIDLHHNLTPASFSLQFEFSAAKSRIVPISVLGQLTWNFCPEDMLLMLCTQIAKDCCHWQLRLAQLCDVNELLQKHPTLDWNWILKQARQQGIERLVILTLRLVETLMDATLPLIIHAWLQTDPLLEELETEVISKLWSDSNSDDSFEESEEPGFWTFLRSYRHRFYLQLRERPIDRLKYGWYWILACLQFLITPNQADFALLSLPNRIQFLYYPFHVIRLIHKFGLRFMKHLCFKLE